MCVSYLFYGSDSDYKEERQAAGDWAGGGVDDKLQGRQKEDAGGVEAGPGGAGEHRGRGCQIKKHWVRRCNKEKASVIRNQASRHSNLV